MSGAAGSKYGIINDGLPVTAKEKVMSKLETLNQYEKAFLFMEDTGIFPVKDGYKSWEINRFMAPSDIRTIFAEEWEPKQFSTAFEAIQAAMKLLKWGE